MKSFLQFNPFYARFSDVFRGYKKASDMKWVKIVRRLHDSCMTTEKVRFDDVRYIKKPLA